MVRHHRFDRKTWILFSLIAIKSRCSMSWQQQSTQQRFVVCVNTRSRNHHESNDSTALHAKKNPQDLRPGSLEAATAELGRVPYGESSRKYRRTIYSHDDWLRHRSNDKLFTNLNSMFFSGVVRQVQNKIFVVCGLSLFLIVWNDYLMPQYDMLPYLRLPILPFSLSSPALGLLLVFKTNTSYQRWLEGRNRWGIIVAHSINIVRMSSTFVDSSTEEGQKSLNSLALAVWILARTIMNSLAGHFEDDADFERQLLDACGCYGENGEGNDNKSIFVNRLLSSPDRTTSALIEASVALDSIPVDEKRRVEIDKSLVILNDARVACDRIFSSPIPLVYTRHTARFLSLWLLVLPFAIHDVFVQANQPGLCTIPAAGLLSLFLFGIEELAVQLEEPFSILPMQKYCDEIQESSRNIIEWSIVSKSSASKSILSAL